MEEKSKTTDSVPMDIPQLRQPSSRERGASTNSARLSIERLLYERQSSTGSSGRWGTSTGSSGRRRTSSGSSGRLTSFDSDDRGHYRRLQNDMQIMTFKVRALEEKVDRVVKDAGMYMEKSSTIERGVAFTARLTENSTVGPLQTLVFDDVITNIGMAYEPTTGLFTVPYPGRYLFSLTVRAQQQKQVCVEIVADNVTIGDLAAGETELDASSASITVVASLEAGRQVYVRHAKAWTGHLHGDGFTTFTGLLLE